MGNVIVVCGPSGCGKTTLIKRLMKEDPSFSFSVSHTTRTPRETEENGVDYHFVSDSDFDIMIEEDAFIEWANVHGAKYGTSYEALNPAIKGDADIILDVDVQGALSLQDRRIEALYIFVSPPSFDALKERLEGRGSEDEESLKLRLWNAKREMEYTPKFSKVVVNDNVDTAYEEFKSGVYDYCKNKNHSNTEEQV